ncbi:class C sortase [Arthrobacter glacialis]|uniref:class C sortase n=1 Tax=Arthrobacter glacialis TaxID=1664 RepID=UPI000CD48537|nr:class C sortase [Arthrobacter glacialis]POH56928.1 class C sortase [Arthrobacter glacialis]
MGRDDTLTQLAQAGAAPGQRGKVPGSVVFIAVLIFVGVSVLLYPTTASWFSTLQQSRDLNTYGSSVEILGPEGRNEALDAAREYNKTLTGGALLDPFNNNPAGGQTGAGAEYRKQLALSSDGLMARLQIPSIKADLPVLHGTSDSVLRRGVGHLFGTALPVGGAGTHAVLTGHSGLPESTIFTDLEEVKVGEQISLEVYGEVLTYRVSSIETILPTETQSLRPVPGEDLLSLITCTPIGINTHRLVVTGERIPTVSADAAPGGRSIDAGFPWWAVGMGTAALGSISILLVAARRGRPHKESWDVPPAS